MPFDSHTIELAFFQPFPLSGEVGVRELSLRVRQKTSSLWSEEGFERFCQSRSYSTVTSLCASTY
jgi:hypothetical protein